MDVCQEKKTFRLLFLMREVKDYILNWIDEFVSVKNEKLNNWAPCPYARQAVLDDKIDWFEINSNIAENLIHREWIDSCDLCIFYIPDVTSEDLSHEVEIANSFLIPNDFVCLEDHPDDIEEVNGVIMNNGKYPLVFKQKLSNLQMFSDILLRKGYYDVWSEQNLEDVVKWRQ